MIVRRARTIDELYGAVAEYDLVLTTDAPLSLALNRRLDRPHLGRFAATPQMLASGANPSPLFENLPLEPTEIDPDVEPVGTEATEQTRLQVSVPMPEAPDGQTPHSLMDDRAFSEVEDGMGAEFGTQVHDFAEDYVNGKSVEPSNDDEREVRNLIDGFPGELTAEENAYLPVDVGDAQVTISGVIDLLHVTDDRVDIVDYKTDRGRHAQSEYRKQLSVYYHVVREAYPGSDVTTSLFYTAEGERVEVEPLTLDEIGELVDRDAGDQLEDEEPTVIR